MSMSAKGPVGWGRTQGACRKVRQIFSSYRLARRTHLNRNANAPIASSSASSSRLRLVLRFPEGSSPTSSLLTVPPSHSIILRTKVSISRPVRDRRQIGNFRRAKDQCWSSNTSNSRTRVLASQGRRREEREESVVVIVSRQTTSEQGTDTKECLYTNQRCVTVFPTTANDVRTFGISDKEVRPCQ